MSSGPSLEPNRDPPEIMHVDLNSAFAMTEQQANPLLRGRPVGVTNRLNDYAICITASYEAKRQGIGIGTRYREARFMSPDFTMVESDPAKYTYVHKKMQQIFSSYSPVAYMKSIDEGIIDFRGMRQILKGRPLEDIAGEIKQRVKDEVGDYMTVNIGIAQNRWLAKVAAGFMKPDGLYVISRDNLEVTYAMLDLLDLPYIKYRNRARLWEAGIYTPLDFYHAPEPVLTKQVFKSINGHHWYLKLRGYETEVEFGIRTVGRSYVLEHRTADPAELAALFYKSSVKLARRLAKNQLAARGLSLALGYASETDPSGRRRHPRWHERQMCKTAVRRGDELYLRCLDLFNRSPQGQVVTSLMITGYSLEPVKSDQPNLFEDDHVKRERLEDAINQVNDRYGELMLAPATVVKSKNPMKDKIPFGSIRYF
jgi:DNA polymerase-4